MGKIIIDREKCKGCLLCIDVCPKKNLKESLEFNSKGNITVLFDDKEGGCIGCALCAKTCPDMAIVEVYK